MVRMKQLLAFPLYATVAWLAWVLGAQVDNDAVMRLLVTLVVVAFALWAWARVPRRREPRVSRRGGGRAGRRRRHRVALCSAADAIASATASRATAVDTAWQPWSPQRVAELTQDGRPVFVDFTAAWCVTCQGEQAARAERRRHARCVRAPQRHARPRRLERRRDPAIHPGAGVPRPQRRAGLSCFTGRAANLCCCRRSSRSGWWKTRSPRCRRRSRRTFLGSSGG
jgi:hypothetical protein